MKSQQADSDTGGGSLDRLVRPLNVLNALVPLGALLLYWSVRSGYDSFYQRFHVTPEQVGIGQVEMIARTAYTLGLLLFLFAGIWISLLVSSTRPRARLGGPMSPPPWLLVCPPCCCS